MAFNPQLIILVLMSTSQQVKAQTLIFVYEQIFGDLLKDPSITELAVNRPDEIFFERNGRREHQAAPSLTYQQVKAFAVNAATFNSQTFEEQSSPVLSAVLPNGEHQFAILRDGPFHCTATNDKQETFIVDSVCFAFLLDIKDLTVHVELAWTNQTSPFGMQYSKILPHAVLYSDPAFANAMGFLLNHDLAMMLPQLNKFRLDLCGTVRLGSCVVTDCIVYGCIAGRNAAKEKPWSRARTKGPGVQLNLRPEPADSRKKAARVRLNRAAIVLSDRRFGAFLIRDLFPLRVNI